MHITRPMLIVSHLWYFFRQPSCIQRGQSQSLFPIQDTIGKLNHRNPSNRRSRRGHRRFDLQQFQLPQWSKFIVSLCLCSYSPICVNPIFFYRNGRRHLKSTRNERPCRIEPKGLYHGAWSSMFLQTSIGVLHL